MDLIPINDLARAPGSGWIATGSDPHFEVRLGEGESFPSGWCRLRCRLAVDGSTPPRPGLYVDSGSGFSEGERADLVWRAGGVDDLVYLPAGTKAVRFDPCETSGPLTVETFDLAPLDAGDPAASRPPPSWLPASRDARLRVVAAHDLARVAGHADLWDATGADPQFHVDVKSIRRRRSRWVRVRARIETTPGTRLRPSLYVRRTGGYGDQHHLRVVGGSIDDVVLVPPGSTGLRIDPLDEVGRFGLSGLSIRPVGPVRAWATILAKLWATLAPEERRPGPLARAALRHLRMFPPSEIPGLIRRRVNRPPMDGAYAAWIDAVERPDRESAGALAARIAGFRTKPVFSIVMPVHETPKEWLVAAIESVRAQAYPHWQLCLCDDASPSPHVGATLARYAAADPRITVVTRRENGHISRATNDALALATGTHMVLMDHDDLIPPHALYEFARVLEAEPEVDFIYSDEDKVTVGGQRHAPFFKPDWSPDTLEGCMYTAHLACYAMGIVREVGGFRPECDGAQDYDFVLRFTERARTVRHVPKILYHWRAIPGSTAADLANKDYASRASVRALSARAERTGGVDIARPGPVAGAFELRRAIVGRPLVSVVVRSEGRDAGGGRSDLLGACLDSVVTTSTYGDLDLIVVAAEALSPDAQAAAGRYGARIVTAGAGNIEGWALTNLGAREARGDLLLALDGDLEVITPDWIETLMAAVQVPGVGIVGARIHAQDGTLQDTGVTFHDGRPDGIRRGYPGDDAGYAYSGVARRTCRALSGGCLMIPRTLFDELGGFDPALGAGFGEADLCLKVQARGGRVVFEPAARLRRLGSRGVVAAVDEVARAALFRARWADALQRDPYYPQWLRTGPSTHGLDPVRFAPPTEG